MFSKKELFILQELKNVARAIVEDNEKLVAGPYILPFNQLGQVYKSKNKTRFECKWVTIILQDDEIIIQSVKEYKIYEIELYKYIDELLE